MASEILAVPEDRLEEVIAIIRCGLKSYTGRISKDTRKGLKTWCDEEEEYLRRMEEE